MRNSVVRYAIGMLAVCVTAPLPLTDAQIHDRLEAYPTLHDRLEAYPTDSLGNRSPGPWRSDGYGHVGDPYYGPYPQYPYPQYPRPRYPLNVIVDGSSYSGYGTPWAATPFRRSRAGYHRLQRGTPPGWSYSIDTHVAQPVMPYGPVLAPVETSAPQPIPAEPLPPAEPVPPAEPDSNPFKDDSTDTSGAHLDRERGEAS